MAVVQWVRPGRPKAGVSNERFSAKVALLSESRITVFPGDNIKISNVLKISPRLRTVPLGLRYQKSILLLIVQFFFSSKLNGSGWAQKVIDESLPATAPSAHSGFSKGRPCLHLMIMKKYTSVCDFPW